MKESDSTSYSHALRYKILTDLYDPVVAWTCREKTFKRALLQQALRSTGTRILDVGCGTATLAIMLKQQRPDVEAVGIDGDEDILRIAAKKAAKSGVKLQLDQGLSYEMAYADGDFDKALSSFFFHHLNHEEKGGTLREIHRVLKPGGELHIADWGKPANLLLRTGFLIVQLLDGFQTTWANVQGLLPDYISGAGFTDVKENGQVITPLGSVSLYEARKPA